MRPEEHCGDPASNGGPVAGVFPASAVEPGAFRDRHRAVRLQEYQLQSTFTQELGALGHLPQADST